MWRRMERNGGGPALALALAAVWLLYGGASAAYSVPADPRRHPSPAPARGGYHHGPAASPRRNHHHHGLSPAPVLTRPHHAPSPSPTSGADGLPSHPPVPVYSRAPEPQATTTPHFGFPLEPTVGVAAGGPSGAPRKVGGQGEGYPFIGSNPTVPLPTGVTDTATVRPLSDTSRGDGDHGKVAGRAGEPVRAGAAMIGLLLSTIVMLLLS